jgi:hypothetical protein
VHKAFYDKKIASISKLHTLLNGQATEDTKRDFFATSTALWDAIKVFVLKTLPVALSHHHDGDNNSNGSTEGPFISGARPGVDDFHVGAWLCACCVPARRAHIEGGCRCTAEEVWVSARERQDVLGRVVSFPSFLSLMSTLISFSLSISYLPTFPYLGRPFHCRYCMCSLG